MASNVQKYLQTLESLKDARQTEEELLEKLDWLWQAMTLEEREEVRATKMSWPPPALIMKEDEDTDGNA